jgi:hypothetical protein
LNLKLVKKENWLVRFGRDEWSRHTYARPANDAIRLLGSVRRGAQIGALGITTDEQYVQVVGDFIVPLNKSQISNAIAKFKTLEAQLPPPSMPRVAAPPPVVVVKRRRVPVMV